MHAQLADSPWFDERLVRLIAREKGYGTRRTNRFCRHERTRLRRAYDRWIATGYLVPAVGGLGTVCLQARRAHGAFAGEWVYIHLGFRGLRTALGRGLSQDSYDRWRLRWIH